MLSNVVCTYSPSVECRHVQRQMHVGYHHHLPGQHDRHCHRPENGVVLFSPFLPRLFLALRLSPLTRGPQDLRKEENMRIWSYHAQVPTPACDVGLCVGEFDVIQGRSRCCGAIELCASGLLVFCCTERQTYKVPLTSGRPQSQAADPLCHPWPPRTSHQQHVHCQQGVSWLHGCSLRQYTILFCYNRFSR